MVVRRNPRRRRCRGTCVREQSVLYYYYYSLDNCIYTDREIHIGLVFFLCRWSLLRLLRRRRSLLTNTRTRSHGQTIRTRNQIQTPYVCDNHTVELIEIHWKKCKHTNGHAPIRTRLIHFVDCTEPAHTRTQRLRNSCQIRTPIRPSLARVPYSASDGWANGPAGPIECIPTSRCVPHHTRGMKGAREREAQREREQTRRWTARKRTKFSGFICYFSLYFFFFRIKQKWLRHSR